ncbi:MAG: glycoside hydrolase family 3 protein [Chloroflexi bacterium]|nr:glycoside hydrolase family 3 protein [Chloroflexota bacterium]
MQQLMHSFEGYRVPDEILKGVRQGEISSFCLFGHWNGDSPAQVRTVTDMLRQAARAGGQPVPLIGIDQEGGQLMAVTHGATELPGNMALGATRSPELAEQAGRVLARELLAMGVNLNFAPSVDINVNPANPVVGVRSFGANPALVADLSVAMIRGIQAEGVIANAKHFPGHGDVSSDTHHNLPVLDYPRSRIDAVELVPFRAAIQAGVQAIMSAHILFSTLDADLPATLSRAILYDFLRGELGFDGLVLTDAMDMTPVARFGAVESTRLALHAGADLVLLAHLPNQLEIAHQTISYVQPAALARIQAARQRADQLALPDLSIVGCAEHQQIAQTIADRSITLVRDGGQLPLRPGVDDTIAVITPVPRDLTPADTSSSAHIGLADAIRQRHPRTQSYQLPAGDNQLGAILDATLGAQIVVVGTVAADQDAAQAELVRTLYARGQQPVVIALRTPYDLIAFPMIKTYLCAYGIRAVTTEAAVRVLFGEIEAVGVLPCPIPDVSFDQI